jgi:hypothetical protein
MPVACLGVVKVCVGAPDGTLNLLLLGLKRIQCIKMRLLNVSHFLSMEMEREK